jgi:lambda family phage portal protein
MTELALIPIESTERPARESGVDASGGPMQTAGLGISAHEGAEKTSRELATWQPAIRSPDAEINREKPTLDARGRDLVRNAGYMQGAVSIHRDSIVGNQFRLNAKPDYKVLGLTEEWAEAFQAEVESKFTLYAESPDCWVDAARMNTLTGLVRMGVGLFVFGGEVLGTVEWMKGKRPFRTALQMVDTDRLSNPQDVADDARLRRGVEKDAYGAPIAYHIRKAHPGDVSPTGDTYTWVRVPVRKPWGRLMVMHIIEQMRPDQTRGVAEMVSVLKEMRMTKKFHDITLQNAVVNATFAAAIESELPAAEAFDSIGAGESTISGAQNLLAQIAEYTAGSRNLQIDGVKIPYLFPNTKLKLLPAGSIGGVGEGFEASLLRNIASALGLSYEQFSRDYTKTNYSSARASMNETWKYMQSRKKIVADRIAQTIYTAWLEEAINTGQIENMPAGAPNFYEGINKDAYAKATWIGASRGQVDEMKETQAAVLRIASGLSTLEAECAGLGKDYREVLEQQLREKKMKDEMGLDFNTAPTKPGTNSAHRAGADNADNADGADNADNQDDPNA